VNWLVHLIHEFILRSNHLLILLCVHITIAHILDKLPIVINLLLIIICCLSNVVFVFISKVANFLLVIVSHVAYVLACSLNLVLVTLGVIH
jgi:hypothetical protein